MLRKIFFISWLVFGFLSLPAWAVDETESSLDIFFIRHAETIGNATKNYSNNRGDILTEKGYQETLEVIKKLERNEYDDILVSPTNRTRLTILPYLKEHQHLTEIWPEIAECCWQSVGPEPESCLKPDGPKILIASQNKNIFRLRDSNSDHFYKTTSYGKGLCQIEDALNLLKEKYWFSGKKILLVSHGNFGRMLITRLLGYSPAPRFHPANARITHLRQTKDGKFHLLRLNDKEIKRYKTPDKF